MSGAAEQRAVFVPLTSSCFGSFDPLMWSFWWCPAETLELVDEVLIPRVARPMAGNCGERRPKAAGLAF